MDSNERAEAVRADLEAGQGCDASKLLINLSPAERLSILKQAVAANQADVSANKVLQFSRPDIIAPLAADEKLVWLTVRDKVQSADGTPRKKPATLIGFNDLTVLPCKNNSSPLFGQSSD